MNKENLQLRRLGENDKVVAFDCDDEDLMRIPRHTENPGLFFATYLNCEFESIILHISFIYNLFNYILSISKRNTILIV